MSAGDWKDMYAAAVAGDLALVRLHISAGVNPNYQHPEILCTPLVASLIHGHDAIARYLLTHGADPKRTNAHGQSITDYLQEFDSFEMRDFVLPFINR